jgi:sodium-dependent dicarboxylate transporter 2/3/5
LNNRKTIYLIIAFLILLIFYIVPTPQGLTYDGMMMIGILIFAAFLFISEAVPLGIAGLLVMALPPILGIFPPEEVFGFFGNEAVFFLIGAFILAAGFQKSGLHRRVASYMLKIFGKSSNLYVLGILTLASSLSFIISEHAVVALLLPIIAVSLINVEKGSNLGKAGMISLTYGATAGSVATLMGGARNPYTVAYLAENYGIHISFLHWMIMALPLTLVMIPVLWLIIINIHKPGNSVPHKIDSAGKMKKDEFIVLGIIVFTLAILFTIRSWGIAVAVIIGAILLFIFNILDWKDIEKSMPWGVILLYGGAMTIGKGLQVTGASKWLASSIVGIIGTNPYLILITLLIITVIMTEMMSHAAAVALMLPIGTGMASTTGMSVTVVAMAIALAGSFGYGLLMGTPGNIITYSTGYFKQKDIMKSGVIADIIGIVLVFIMATFLWPLMGVV